MEEFCKRLKKAMQIRNISQKELCEKTGIPKSAMSQYMSGSFKPKHERSYLIAKALDVSVAWLMGHDVDMNFSGISFLYNPADDEEDISNYVWHRFPESSKQTVLEIIKDLEMLNHSGHLEVKKRIKELMRLEEYMDEELYYKYHDIETEPYPY